MGLGSINNNFTWLTVIHVDCKEPRQSNSKINSIYYNHKYANECGYSISILNIYIVLRIDLGKELV